MLVGLGREPELVLVTERLPELGPMLVEAERNLSVTFPRVTMKLNAVMFEDGTIAGPMGEKFREKVNGSIDVATKSQLICRGLDFLATVRVLSEELLED